MLDLKPYGAFVENTLRPMLEEAKILISELQGYGLYLDKENLTKFGKFIAEKHLKVIIIQSLTNIIITGIICGTLWKIYPLLSR